MYPIVVYDFETVNDYSFTKCREMIGKNELTEQIFTEMKRTKSFPIEISILYQETPHTKPSMAKIKIQFPYRFSECSEYQKEGLKFYVKHLFGIENPTEKQIVDYMKVHNKNAKTVKEAFLHIARFFDKSFNILSHNQKEFTLIGKNNHDFDDHIFNYFLDMFAPSYTYSILKSSFDLEKFVREQNRSGEHSLDLKLKYFRFGSFSLENLYKGVFGKELVKAHDSITDVKATYLLFKKYFDTFPKLMENSCQTNYINLTEQFRTFSEVKIE